MYGGGKTFSIISFPISLYAADFLWCKLKINIYNSKMSSAMDNNLLANRKKIME